MGANESVQNDSANRRRVILITLDCHRIKYRFSIYIISAFLFKRFCNINNVMKSACMRVCLCVSVCLDVKMNLNFTLETISMIAGFFPFHSISRCFLHSRGPLWFCFNLFIYPTTLNEISPATVLWYLHAIIHVVHSGWKATQIQLSWNSIFRESHLVNWIEIIRPHSTFFWSDLIPINNTSCCLEYVCHASYVISSLSVYFINYADSSKELKSSISISMKFFCDSF